jgi:hypothetical protein
MVAKVLVAYLDFVESAGGSIIVVGLSLVVCAAIVLWARQVARDAQWPLLLAAGTLTLLLAGIYAVAVVSGLWGGRYFQTPLIVQLATLLPPSLAGWIAWLMGYGWVAGHSRYALLTYVVVGLLIILGMALADRGELSGGLLLVAPDGAIWINAILGVAMMLAPVLLFEGIRRSLARDTLP